MLSKNQLKKAAKEKKSLFPSHNVPVSAVEIFIILPLFQTEIFTNVVLP